MPAEPRDRRVQVSAPATDRRAATARHCYLEQLTRASGDSNDSAGGGLGGPALFRRPGVGIATRTPSSSRRRMSYPEDQSASGAPSPQPAQGEPGH
jgi:hypothetical protein